MGAAEAPLRRRRRRRLRILVRPPARLPSRILRRLRRTALPYFDAYTTRPSRKRARGEREGKKTEASNFLDCTSGGKVEIRSGDRFPRDRLNLAPPRVYRRRRKASPGLSLERKKVAGGAGGQTVPSGRRR